jgi:uncharacterized protein (TIGR00369 family)
MADASTDGTFLADREGVDGCFGCGPGNAGGLRLRFRELADRSVETRVQVADHFSGMEGVVHGGIQATILDEVMGVAAQLELPAEAGRSALVTAELSVRYLAPVPIAGEVLARARVVTIDGPDTYVHGEIVDGDGRELTTARSRWRLPRRS